ncbi:hypothetical protein Lal_00033516 [Lupinus albus]|nr:hypothetical protein Lal_00033516 [Lupinus albus]
MALSGFSCCYGFKEIVVTLGISRCRIAEEIECIFIVFRLRDKERTEVLGWGYAERKKFWCILGVSRLSERASPKREAQYLLPGFPRILAWARERGWTLKDPRLSENPSLERESQIFSLVNSWFRVGIQRMEKILRLEAVSEELVKLPKTKPNSHQVVPMAGRGTAACQNVPNDLLAQMVAALQHVNENLQTLNQNASPSLSSQPLVPPGPTEYRGLDEFCRRNPS